MLIDVTKELEKQKGLEEVKKFQKSILHILEMAGKDLKLNWADWNIHFFLNRINNYLLINRPFAYKIYNDSLKKFNINIKYKKKRIYDSNTEKSSNVSIFPDYISPSVINIWETDGFYDYRLYPGSWWTAFTFSKILYGKLFIDSKNNPYRIFLESKSFSNGYRIKFKRVNILSGEETTEGLTVGVSFEKKLVKFKVELDKKDRVWSEFSENILKYFFKQTFAYTVDIDRPHSVSYGM